MVSGPLKKANPFHINGPISKMEAFFGRSEELIRIREYLSRGERIIAIDGPPLIGKSSFLFSLSTMPPKGYFPVYLNEPALLNGQDDLSSLLVQRWNQLCSQEAGFDHSVPAPPPSLFGGTEEPEGFEGPIPLLLIDNLDKMVAGDEEGGASLLSRIDSCLAAFPGCRLICAITSVSPQLSAWKTFSRASRLTLGRFRREETFRLVRSGGTSFEFEYEAIERIDELTGRHPFFIQLLCHQIFELRHGSGRAGLVDIEPALLALGKVKITPFQEGWDRASSEGKIILSILGSQKGSYEVMTIPEMLRLLRREGYRVQDADVDMVVHELVRAGLFEQLGAGSFRFSVEIFRYWIRLRHSISRTKMDLHWNRRARRLQSGKQGDSQSRRLPYLLTVTILIPLLAVVVAAGFFLFVPAADETPTPTVGPTPGLATLVAQLVTPRDTPALPAETPTGPSALADITPISPEIAVPLLRGDEPAIVYVFREGREPGRLWLKRINNGIETPLSSPQGELSAPTWAPDGLRVAMVIAQDDVRDIYSWGIDGTAWKNLTDHEGDNDKPAWSPDGTEIAFASFREENWDIFIMWADGTAPIRLTDNPQVDTSPTWSPDGRRIAFASNRDGNWNIYVMNRDGTNIRQLTRSSAHDTSPAWSPDGKYLAFESTRDGGVDLFIMREDGNEQFNLTRSRSSLDQNPDWSPDGKKVVFDSNRDGSWDIFTITIETGELIKLTEGNGSSREPAWRP